MKTLRDVIVDAVHESRPTFNQAVDALRPVFRDEMLLIRKIRGVRLRDGRERITSSSFEYVLYDVGVQEEGDSAVLWGWEEITEILI